MTETGNGIPNYEEAYSVYIAFMKRLASTPADGQRKRDHVLSRDDFEEYFSGLGSRQREAQAEIWRNALGDWEEYTRRKYAKYAQELRENPPSLKLRRTLWTELRELENDSQERG